MNINVVIGNNLIFKSESSVLAMNYDAFLRCALSLCP